MVGEDGLDAAELVDTSGRGTGLGGRVNDGERRRPRRSPLQNEGEGEGRVDLGEERRKWGWGEMIEATGREGILIPSSARREAMSGFDNDHSRGSVEQEEGKDDMGGGVGRLGWADGQLGRWPCGAGAFSLSPLLFLFFFFFSQQLLLFLATKDFAKICHLSKLIQRNIVHCHKKFGI